MKPQVLPPNVLRHFYAGGARIAAFRGLTLDGDHMPEEWIGAVNTTFGAVNGRGLSHAQVVEATERAWRKQAEAARMVRTIAAPILMILGAGAIGTGVYFGVTNQQVGDLSASDQGAWSAT